MTDNTRCETVVDSDGTVLGHARVAADLSDEGRAALVELTKAAIRLMAERDAADPEGAAERGRRQQAAIARLRGEAG